MNTATSTRTSASQEQNASVEKTPATGIGSLSFPRVVRAEWIKFTSLRSTWWSLALVAVISLGLSTMQAAAIGSFNEPTPGATPAQINDDAVMVIVFSTVLTQLLAVIIGTISVTGEYSTGMIRSTLAADPGRIKSLLAKTTVIASTLFVFSLIVFGITALVTGPMLPNGGVNFSDFESSFVPLLSAALYLALIAALGIGAGFVIRNGPGALAVGIGLVFVAPVLVLFFPQLPDFQWVFDLAAYLPSNAGQSLFMGQPMSGETLDTWPALITMVAWAAFSLAAGAAVLKSRDA